MRQQLHAKVSFRLPHPVSCFLSFLRSLVFQGKAWKENKYFPSPLANITLSFGRLIPVRFLSCLKNEYILNVTVCSTYYQQLYETVEKKNNQQVYHRRSIFNATMSMAAFVTIALGFAGQLANSQGLVTNCTWQTGLLVDSFLGMYCNNNDWADYSYDWTW